MPTDDAVDERQSWRAFAVCALGAALPVLDVTKVYVIAPAMEAGVHASALSTQLAIAGYVLTFGLVLIPAGRYGDLHSRRSTFLLGVALFGLASLAVGAAPNEQVLVISRLLQGVSGALITPQVIGLIQQLFTGATRMRAFGMLGAIFGLATSLAPAIGGLLVGVGGPELGWRLAFLMNVPIALVVLVLAPRLIPKYSQVPSAIRDFDPFGAVLLAFTTVSLLAPFVLSGDGVHDDPRRWLILVGVPVFGAAFVLWEQAYARRGRLAIVDLALFRVASYRNGVIITVGYYGAMSGTLLLISLFLQTGLRQTPLTAGIAAITLSLGYAISSFLSGRLVVRWGRLLVIVGSVVFGIGLSATLVVGLVAPPGEAPWLMMITLGVAGLGGGCVAPPNQALSMQDISPLQGGLAGSIQQVGQRLGSAVGVAIAASIFATTFAREAITVGDLSAGRHAFASSMTIALAFVVATFVLAAFDLAGRRRRAARENPTSAG